MTVRSGLEVTHFEKKNLKLKDTLNSNSREKPTKGLFIYLPNFGMPFSNVPFWTLRKNFGAKILARYFGNKMACHF